MVYLVNIYIYFLIISFKPQLIQYSFKIITGSLFSVSFKPLVLKFNFKYKRNTQIITCVNITRIKDQRTVLD